MPNENKPTTDEHYISQFYLKGFSPDKNRVYQYDIQNWKKYPLISTRKICFKKNLYEFTNESGDIVACNTIEKALSKYESVFHDLLINIANKANDFRNTKTHSFLTSREKTLLVGLMSIQIMRMPNFIEMGEEIALQINQNIQPYEARNFTLLSSFQFLTEAESNEKNLFFYIANWFADKTFIILKSNTHNIFTSDNPIFMHSKNKYSTDIELKPDKIIYPLSSNLVLYMLPLKEMPHNCRNRLFPMSSEHLREIHQSISVTAKRFLYSYRSLTNDEICIIKEARAKKEWRK